MADEAGKDVDAASLQQLFSLPSMGVLLGDDDARR
jgi:hypothetical protein